MFAFYSNGDISDSDDSSSQSSNEGDVFSPLFKSFMKMNFLGGESGVKAEIEKDIRVEEFSSSESDEYSSNFESDDYYDTDFETDSEEDERRGDEEKDDEVVTWRERKFAEFVINYQRVVKFDTFCQEYYACLCIVKFMRGVIATKAAQKKAKHMAMLQRLLEQEKAKLAAVRERKAYLARKRAHENFMAEVRAGEMARISEERRRIEEEKKEREVLKVNLDKRKAEIKAMLDYEEKQWGRELEEREKTRKEEERKRIDEEKAEKKLAELNIMREQQKKFFERRRKQMLEKQIEERLEKISEVYDKEHSHNMRLKLKKVSEEWKERNRMNKLWKNIRRELMLYHHQQQFRPVLQNMLRFSSYKESSEKWVIVADELREKVKKVESNVLEKGEGRDGGCAIM